MMTSLPDPTAPDWLLPNPEPRFERRKFNKKEYIGWLGRARLTSLSGWIDNPRVEIPVQQHKDRFLREPNNDELLEIMLDVSMNDRADDSDDEEEEADVRRTRKNKLLELAESIKLNGVRVPLIVTADKRILDGNRRYFASLYLYRLAEGTEEQDQYREIPVWVLPSSVDRDDEDRILTELNSINDCYVKWPYSVRARRVYRDYKEGMSIEDLARKYHDWTKSSIWNVIEASRVAEEFIEFHGDDVNAQDLAYRKLIWFDELRRSNNKAMEIGEFRNGIYELILDEDTPFSSHKDFKRLGEIYNNPEAWGVLTTQKGKPALKQAEYIIDRERYEGKSDAQSRMRRINDLLNGVISGPGFGTVEPETLGEFHQLAALVPTQDMDPAARSETLMRLLDSLTSKEIGQLSATLREDLRIALERVNRQADSYQYEE